MHYTGATGRHHRCMRQPLSQWVLGDQGCCWSRRDDAPGGVRPSRPPLHVHVVIQPFAYLPSQMTRQTAALATSDVVSARVAMAQQLAGYKSEIFMANWDTPSVLDALAWSAGSTSSVCTCHLRAHDSNLPCCHL